MTKARAFPAVAIALILLTAFNTFLILRGQGENHKRAEEGRTLAVENHKLADEGHKLAVANCRNIGSLASIERAFINRQEAQTQALLSSGVTFGIAPEKLPALIQASRDSQALFLHELDSLSGATCAAANPPVVPVVPPGRRATPKAKRRTGSAGSTGSHGTARTAQGRQRSGNVVVPEHPRTTSRATPRAPSAPVAAPVPSPAPPASPPVLPPAEGSHVTIPVPCVRTAVLSTC